MSVFNVVVIGFGFGLLACGGGNESSSPVSCEEACEVGNLSNNDLRDRFGSPEVPAQYQFVEPFLDKGAEAFQVCIQQPGNDLFTSSCTAEGLEACVKACSASR